jgi:hypothetical protein
MRLGPEIHLAYEEGERTARATAYNSAHIAIAHYWRIGDHG